MVRRQQPHVLGREFLRKVIEEGEHLG